MRRGINFLVLRAALVSLLSLLSGACVFADDWLPVNSADLAAKDSADKPGAHAIYLYREDIRDDMQSREDVYERIKIFTEEGKQHGDIEIPYYRDVFSITNVRARTIRPDGSTVEWNGKLLDKTIVKSHGYRVQAKTFTLPEVEAGCIIEYRYRMALNASYLYDNTWEIQKELFTKEAKLSFHPSPLYDLVSIPYGVSASTPINKEKDGTMRLDLQNVPALEKEDYMPPEEAVTSRVDFYYTEHGTIDPDKFWKNTGQLWFEGSERYIGHRKAISEEVSRTVGPNDPPETKLRKLYTRVQMIRNTSFEREKTIQEVKRENQKANDNVEDLLKHGVGNGVEIDYLFCALARAAGFEASVVRVSTRNAHFFTTMMLEANKLNDVVISVKLGDKDLYLDPGNAHAPYGLLPWSETGVQGLKLEKGGGRFVTTTNPSPDDAVTTRVAKLIMGDDGLLNGKLTVTYAGQEALSRRLEADENDDAQRAKSLVDEVKALVPAGATVDLTNSPDWNGPDAPLVAEFDVKSRAWGTQTGRRLLVSQSFFSHPVARQFEHPSRIYPVYFDFPYTDLDDITLQLPLVLRASNLPASQVRTNGMGFYEISSENQAGSLHLVRKMGVSGILYPAQSYPAIRNFFNQVRAGDEEQIVLEGSR
jgi:hypothetical protein